MNTKDQQGRDLAIACAKAAEEIQAVNIRVLEVKGLSTLTDYLVICTGNSMPHLKAVLRDIEKIVREGSGEEPMQTEGKSHSRWVILDYVDVMIHVMLEDVREMYALEDLWGNAKEVEWHEAAAS